MKKNNIKAYAKLNLFLDILGKRGDGYHEIITTMLLIDLADEVSVEIGDGDEINLTCTVPDIPLDTRNAAYRAAALFLERLGEKRRVNIDIIKKIPVMAGLGGSSADAAAVLLALNELFDKPFSMGGLLETGAKIGSDVPFCIHGGFALCTGTGAEIKDSFPVPNDVYVIIKPEFSCSSKEAYALYAESVNPADNNLNIKQLDYKTIIDKYYNIFEKLYNNPEIEKIKNKLKNAGAKEASLTGSGSAVFGVFDDTRSARAAFAVLDYDEKFIAQAVSRRRR